MKLLFFNTNIGYGGASKMMVAVANHLAEKNDVTFLTFRNADVLQPLSDKAKHVHNPLYQNKNKILELAGQILALRKYIKQEKFDLAFAFLHPAHYMLTLAAKGTDTKVLLSERGDPSRSAAKGMIKYSLNMMFRILQTADAYVFQTKQASEYYSDKARRKSCVIPNPISDTKIPDPYIGQRKKIIVNVARLDIPQKRQDVLIDAFAKMDDQFNEYFLYFYGDGPDEKKIKQYAEDSGVGHRIKFMGVSENVLEDISDYSLFAFSSDFEGIPNALLEAMAVGLPCVSTDCSPGGARLLIQDNENGFLVPRNDSQALSKAMERILGNRELAEKLGKNAVSVKETFARDRIFGMWEDFVTKIVGDENYEKN